MLTNTTVIGTAMLPLQRVTIPARTAVPPRAQRDTPPPSRALAAPPDMPGPPTRARIQRTVAGRRAPGPARAERREWSRGVVGDGDEHTRVWMQDMIKARQGIPAHLTHLSRNESRAGSAACYAAGAFLMAFAALVALPLQAQQTVITLVSNTGQASSNFSANSDRAQGFTTGSNADGYTLSSIDIVSGDPQGTSFTATLYTSNTSGHPGTAVATLTAPVSFAAGTLTFTAPANTTLSANRDYFVLVSVSVSGAALDLSYTGSDAEDSGAATGWSIANDYLWDNSGTWQTTTTGASFLIGVKGYANTGTPNTAPTTTGGRVTTPAGTAYTFSAADFNFFDSDPGDTLESVKITSVPDVVAGTVNVNGDPGRLHGSAKDGNQS